MLKVAGVLLKASRGLLKATGALLKVARGLLKATGALLRASRGLLSNTCTLLTEIYELFVSVHACFPYLSTIMHVVFQIYIIFYFKYNIIEIFLSK
ncbi:MAG: hypothetical protein MI739_06005, partial [Bacteroidales bacterium]|nr:hypothetical protein [Bacteroidales bacterium]